MFEPQYVYTHRDVLALPARAERCEAFSLKFVLARDRLPTALIAQRADMIGDVVSDAKLVIDCSQMFQAMRNAYEQS